MQEFGWFKQACLRFAGCVLLLAIVICLPSGWRSAPYRLAYVTHPLALVRSTNIDTGSRWLRRRPAMISFEKSARDEAEYRGGKHAERASTCRLCGFLSWGWLVFGLRV